MSLLALFLVALFVSAEAAPHGRDEEVSSTWAPPITWGVPIVKRQVPTGCVDYRCDHECKFKGAETGLCIDGNCRCE